MIQAVLLFGAETWVVTPHMGKALGGFHIQVYIRLMGQLLRRTKDRTWKYTSAAAARELAGFLTMEEYVRRRQNFRTVYRYAITVRPVCGVREGSWGASRDAVVGIGWN